MGEFWAVVGFYESKPDVEFRESRRPPLDTRVGQRGDSRREREGHFEALRSRGLPQELRVQPGDFGVGIGEAAEHARILPRWSRAAATPQFAPDIECYPRRTYRA